MFGVSRGHWLLISVLLAILADVAFMKEANPDMGRLQHIWYSVWSGVAFIMAVISDRKASHGD